MRYLAACMTAIVVLLLLSGCSGVQESFAEREIVRRAPEIIGPADRYDANVRGLTETHADEVVVNGQRVRPMPNLVIQSLQLTMRNVTFQREPFRILNIGSTDFTARLTDRDVAAYLAQSPRVQQAGIQNIAIAFLQNSVRMSALVPVGGQNAQVTTTGMLQAAGGTRVNYLPQQVMVAGFELPPDFLQQIADRINPVIDLTELRFAPQIRQIVVTPGAASLSGTATVRNVP